MKHAPNKAPQKLPAQSESTLHPQPHQQAENNHKIANAQSEQQPGSNTAQASSQAAVSVAQQLTKLKGKSQRQALLHQLQEQQGPRYTNTVVKLYKEMMVSMDDDSEGGGSDWTSAPDPDDPRTAADDAAYQELTYEVYDDVYANSSNQGRVINVGGQAYKFIDAINDPRTALRAVGWVPVYWGYDPDLDIYHYIIDTTQPPVLGFRGTLDRGPDMLKTFATDGDQAGVGYSQFDLNRQGIVNLLTELQNYTDGDKRVAVTGQSLGGALAQWTTAYLPDMIKKTYTFNSPAIDLSKVSPLNPAAPCMPSDTVQTVVRGDIVSRVGKDRIQGAFYEVTTTEFAAYSAALKPARQALDEAFDLNPFKDPNEREKAAQTLGTNLKTISGAVWQLHTKQVTDPRNSDDKMAHGQTSRTGYTMADVLDVKKLDSLPVFNHVENIRKALGLFIRIYNDISTGKNPDILSIILDVFGGAAGLADLGAALDELVANFGS